jgi:putative hemolysin
MKRQIVIAALLAAACQPLPAEDAAQPSPDQGVTEIDTTDVPPPVRVPESAEAAECQARGGTMLPQGRLQTMRCVVTYTDAGQRCADGDQCQGDCRVEDVANAPRAGSDAVGQCQATSSRFGCYTTVEHGKAEATICVD